MPDTVKALDPAQPAPPVVVDRNPGRDAVGHGRTLPLVGGIRPHVYDVVYADGTRRVYADTPGDVLAAVIPGYEEHAAAMAAAQDAVESLLWNPDGSRREGVDPEQANDARDRVQRAFVDAFDARSDHATALRMTMQRNENERARANGQWDDLDDEARAQCEASVQGEIPVGIIYIVPEDTGEVERGFWPFEAPRLVISRGDYGLFDPAGTEEPESLATVVDDDGHEYVPVVRFPRNLVILDPTEESLYVESLEVAGVLSCTIRPVDLPDEQYSGAVALGATMRQAGEAGGVPFDE